MAPFIILAQTQPQNPSLWRLQVRRTHAKSSATARPHGPVALIEIMGHGDDDAVARMAHAALQNASNATDEELAYFIRDEAERVLRNRKLDTGGSRAVKRTKGWCSRDRPRA